MSKHQRTAGVDYRENTINGKTYRYRPLTVGIYASMESFIVSKRPDPLAIAAESVKRLPPNYHDAVWKAAMHEAVTARTVTAPEMAAFENSVDGLAWKLWQCLKDNHPEIDSIDAAKQILIDAGDAHFEQLARTVEIATGEADIKKSSGQAEKDEEIAALAGQ